MRARSYNIDGFWMDRDLDTAYEIEISCEYYPALTATHDSPAEPEELFITSARYAANKLPIAPSTFDEATLNEIEAHCLDRIHSGYATWYYADRD